MRRRLKRLGVAPAFQSAGLEAVSVEGGGLDIRRADGQGQVLTGPGLDASLLEVFPELLPHTLTALTTTAAPGASDSNAAASNPSTSGGNALYVNLQLFLKSYLVSAVTARYVTGGTGLPLGGDLHTCTITDPYGSGLVNGGGTMIGQTTDFAWSAAGLNWVEINSTQTNVTPGSKSFSFSVTTFTSWTGSLAFSLITIDYTNPPCLTCEITVEVSHGCTGSGLGGVDFTLSNGQTCSTNGGGECTISGIPDGDYTYTVTKTNFVSKNGSFSCVCLTGGTTVISVRLDPVGGCKPPPDPTSDDPPGFWASVQGYARRWRYWFDGPVIRTQAYRRTDGDCGEDGGISVGSECDEEGGVSTRG